MPSFAARMTIAHRALCAVAMMVAPLPAHADPPPSEPSVRATEGQADPLEPEPATGESGVPVRAEPPEMAVTVQPAEAYPGDEVVLTFASLRPRASIVECMAFFPNDRGGICQRSSRRWLARTRVPPDAEPGPTLLRWGAASITDGGQPVADSGAFVFTVRARAGEKPPPAFRVRVTPSKARPGEHVTVAASAVDGGVTITGCRAGFGVGGSMAACRDTQHGWVADVTVPGSAPAGAGTVVWNVAYDRAGPGTADGVAGLEVVPNAGRGFWSTLFGFGGRIGLGVLAVAGFLAYPKVRKRRKQRRARAGELPADVAVSPLPDAGVFRTVLGAPPREPHPVIRLCPIDGTPRAGLHEEQP